MVRVALALALAWAQDPSAPEAVATPQPTPAPTGSQLDDLADRRDPFKKPDLAPKFDRSVTELETFSTLEYRMVGVVAGGDRTRAMLLGPNGKTYFVKEGDKIGIQRGAIVKITPERVLVRERVSNLLGKEELNTTEIRLPTETGVSTVTPSDLGRTDVEYQQTIESMKRSAAKKSADAKPLTPIDEKKALEELKTFTTPVPDVTLEKKGD